MQGTLDLRSPTLSTCQTPIPPDRVPGTFQSTYQPNDSGLILALVGDENLAHRSARCFSSSIIQASLRAKVPCFCMARATSSACTAYVQSPDTLFNCI